MKISEHTIPDTVCHVSRVGTGGKEDPAPSKDLLYLWFFPVSPICNPCSPLVYKRGTGHATKGTDRFHTQYTAKQQPSTWRPFDLSIRDLGPVPLSTICTPYYEPFSVLKHEQHKLDVGTFCLNQYKPCVI